MPRLPDETALGPRPTPRPGRLPSTQVAERGIKEGANVVSQIASQSGAAPAALAKMAENVQIAQDRIQTRDDTVERARAITNFNRTVNDEFWRVQDEEDLSLNETGKKFNEFVAKTKNDMLTGHTGSSDSSAALAERLELMSGGFVNQAAAAGLDAKKTVMASAMTDAFNGAVTNIYENPGSLRENYESLKRQIDDMSPALTVQEEEVYRKQLATLPISAVSSFLDAGNYKEAEKLLETTPGLDELVPADKQLALRSRIAALEQAEIKSTAARGKKLTDFEFIMGRKATPEEREKIGRTLLGPQTLEEQVAEFEDVMGRPATGSEVTKMAGASAGETLADKISAYEAEVGRDATDDEKATMAGAFREDQQNKIFGGGPEGRSLAMMTNLAEGYESGVLSEQQERQFLSAVTHYTQPRAYQNPDSGLWETRTPVLPPYVQDALEARAVQPEPVPEAPPPEIERSGRPAGTAWSLSGLSAGPIPAIGQKLSETPVVGEFVRARQMTVARGYITQIQRDLVRVLQNNPKYAEGERKAIESEISIKPQVWDTPSAYRDRLIGIDNALDVREKTALKTSRNPNVSSAERKHANDVYNGLVEFRESMGVPPRVYEDEGDPAKNKAYQALEPGTEFIIIRKNGEVVRVVKPAESQ